MHCLTLDCAVLNFGLPKVEDYLGIRFQTVRGVFQEGAAAFSGSDIRKKSHIQVPFVTPPAFWATLKLNSVLPSHATHPAQFRPPHRRQGASPLKACVVAQAVITA